VETRSAPMVDGEIGLKAVRLARTVAEGIREHNTEKPNNV